MDNPDGSDKTIINVKSVRKSSWEAARRGAAQCGDSMGTWLSDAIDQRISRDADAVNPPAKNGNESGNPTTLTHDQLTERIRAIAELQQATAAMKSATGRATGMATLLSGLALLRQHIGEGITPELRLIRGQSLRISGNPDPE